MKSFIITAAAATLLAGPVLAQSQLEKQLGVDAGAFTTSELAALAFGQSHETGDGARVTADSIERGMIVSTSQAGSSDAAAFARDHFDRIGERPGEQE